MVCEGLELQSGIIECYRAPESEEDDLIRKGVNHGRSTTRVDIGALCLETSICVCECETQNLCQGCSMQKARRTGLSG